MAEDTYDFKKSLKQAAEDHAIDFAPTKPEEVIRIVDNKDSYKESITEAIFQALKQLKEVERQNDVAITISLGFVLEDGDPKWELDWLVRMIELGTLSELSQKKIISSYEEKTRPFAENGSYDEVIAVITCNPEKFLDWYGMEVLGLNAMGNVLAFHSELARALGSVTAAIYYLQIYKWYNDEPKDLDGYIAKSKDMIRTATTLTRSEQDPVKERLERDGWLDVRPGKYGFKADRFKPLKPITISTKDADALQQISRARSEALSRLDELYAELEAIELSIEENPTRVLQVYENKATGELPPIDGNKKKSTFGRLGDDIWDRKGFERYDHDENAMLKDYARYKSDIKSRGKKKEEIRALREKLSEKKS
jgi:hypothetical protein